MYLYYDKQGKLQTAIAHGSPVRQGDSFGLYVCFDLDYFNANKKFVGEEGFCYTYKRPGDSGLTGPIDFDSSDDSKDGYLGAKKFVKLYDSEITYKLIDNKKYLTFYTNVPSNLDGFTAKNGEVEVQFTFKTINENQQVDTTVLTANIYVEPTYKKDNYVLDETLAAQTNFEQVMTSIAQLRAEKNIALLELDHNVASTDEYATLQDRANEIFSTWVYTRIGWVLIGAKRDITQTVEDIAPTSIEHINTDLFIILDGKNNYDENEQLVSTVGNIFAVDSETGLMWNYEITLNGNGNLISSVPTQLTYNKEYFDMLLGDLRGFLNEVDNGKPYYTNLTVGLRDFLDRIKHIENNAVYKVSYSSSTGKFTYHEGNNLLDTDKERDIVDNDTLRTDLGIKSIENNAVFDVEYTKPYLKVKKGLNSEKQTILTTSNVIQNEEYVATVKAVYDTLEKAATNEANSNTEVFNGLMRKISYISQFFFEGADVDDKVNKLEEVLEILKNIPENYDIYSLLTNIYDKIGEQFEDSYFYNPEWSDADKAANSIKGKIQFLQQNTDRHIVIIMRYSEGNQEFFTLDNWIQLEEENETYPEATCYTTLQNDVFKNAVDMEIVFDKTVEQGYVLGSELDTDSGTLTIYVLEEPEETLTIDTIKIISNVFHTTNISVDALNQIVTNRVNIAANTTDISNLSRDKQDKSNLVNEWSITLSQTKYPSEKLVKESLDAKGTLVSTFTGNVSDDTKYPSAKLVKTELDKKATISKTTLNASNFQNNTNIIAHDDILMETIREGTIVNIGGVNYIDWEYQCMFSNERTQPTYYAFRLQVTLPATKTNPNTKYPITIKYDNSQPIDATMTFTYDQATNKSVGTVYLPTGGPLDEVADMTSVVVNIKMHTIIF